MTKFKSCAAGFIALAAMIGSATVQADPITWFSENSESVAEALTAGGETTYGNWSAGTGSLSESLYVGSGEQDGKVCVDTDGENRLAYTPKVQLTGNTATIKLENICFTAPVEVDDSQLEGVQAAVAIVDDPDSGALTFKVAENGQWVAPPDLLNGNEIFPSSTYTVTCVFDYGAGTVTYTVVETGGEYTATLPDGAQPVSVTEFEGTCSFESLSGEKEPTTFTLTLPEVPGIVSYTIGDEPAKKSGDWTIAEGVTPTITIAYAKGYIGPEKYTLPAPLTGNVEMTDAEVIAALGLVEGVAMIGDTPYKTLQDAADAVQDGETIQVWKDFSVASSIYVTNKTDVTFDLNGKTVEYTGNGYALCFFDTTIKLTSSVEGGEFKKTGSGTLGLVGSAQTKPDHGGKYSTATVVINDGLWYCTTASGSCFKLENGTVTLNDGVVEHAVLEANEDMVAFAVTTNTEGVISTLNLVGGTVKGYIERNETATQTYDATTLTQFTIQQDELCATGYKMVKGEGDEFYTIQESVEPETFTVTVNAPDGVTVTGAPTEPIEAGNVELTVTPAEGYKNVVVKVGETVIPIINNVYTIAVSKDTTVDITVDKITYATVTVVKDDGVKSVTLKVDETAIDPETYKADVDDAVVVTVAYELNEGYALADGCTVPETVTLTESQTITITTQKSETTRPSAIEEGSDEQKAAYDAWATKHGVSGSEASYVDAFILDAEPTATKEDLEAKLGAEITADMLTALMADGSPDFTALQEKYPNATFEFVPVQLEGSTANLFKLKAKFVPANASED